MMGDKVLTLESLGSDYGAYFATRGFVDLLGADRVRSWPYKRTNDRGHDSYPERVRPGDGSKVLQPYEPDDPNSTRVVYGPYYSGSEMWAHRAMWRMWKPEKNLPGHQLPSDGPLVHVRPLGIPEETDERIFEMVAEGEFSLVVLNGCRWHGSAALHELQATFGERLPPVVVIDHDDYPQRRWDFCDQFKPVIYFKRTFLGYGGHPSDYMFGKRPDVVVRPFPFSSMWNVEWVPWEKREIDVFCVFGPTQVMRRKLKDVTMEVCEKFAGLRVRAAIGHPMLHPEYLKVLATAKVVIDQQSFGTDTLRFWEAAAAGAMPISDFSLRTPPEEIVAGDHYVRYDNDLSSAGDQQDFVRFRAMLEEAIQDDVATERRARRLYDTVRRDHTCEARARYVLREVRDRGHALAGLP